LNRAGSAERGSKGEFSRGDAARLRCNQKRCIAVNRKELREKAKSKIKIKDQEQEVNNFKARVKNFAQNDEFFYIALRRSRRQA